MFNLEEVIVISRAYKSRSIFDKIDRLPVVDVKFYRPERNERTVEYNGVTAPSFRRISKVLEDCNKAASVQSDGESFFIYYDVR